MWYKDSAWGYKEIQVYCASGFGVCTFSDGQKLNGYFTATYTERCAVNKSYPDTIYSINSETLVDMQLELQDSLPKLEITDFFFGVLSLTTQALDRYQDQLQYLRLGKLSCICNLSEPFIIDKIRLLTSTRLDLTCKFDKHIPLLVTK